MTIINLINIIIVIILKLLFHLTLHETITLMLLSFFSKQTNIFIYIHTIQLTILQIIEYYTNILVYKYLYYTIDYTKHITYYTNMLVYSYA